MKQPMIRSAFEQQALRMAEGFRGMPANSPQLVFRHETMVPAQAAARMQEALTAFQTIRDAEEAHRSAVEKAHRSMAGFQAFYDEAVIVVKAHYGSDAKRLREFGLGPALPTRRRGRREPREGIRTEGVEELAAVVEAVVVEAQPAPRHRHLAPEVPRVPPTTPPISTLAGAHPASRVKTSSKPKRGSR